MSEEKLIVIPDDFPSQFKGSEPLRKLERYGRVICHDSKAGNENELIRRMRGAAGIICVRNFTRFNSQVLHALPDLRIISLSGTGTDNIDFEVANRQGVAVTNTPSASSVSVAEHTFALILAAARSVARSDRLVREGRWEHKYGMELQGKTLGLVGLGRIAQQVCRIASGFGMKVLAWSFTCDQERADRCGAEQVELDCLLACSDIVSLHLRASERSAGLMDRAKFALMKPGALFINTARAAIVSEADLIEVLRQRKIAGAALDVFEQEPLPPNHPFLSLDNLVLTPHSGWVTVEANQRLIEQPIDNLIAFFEGYPQNVVNPQVLSSL